MIRVGKHRQKTFDVHPQPFSAGIYRGARFQSGALIDVHREWVRVKVECFLATFIVV